MAERIISAPAPCAKWPKQQASATIPAAGRGGMALVVDVEAIHSWLTARLDEDERVARAVKPLRRVAVMGGPMDEKFSVSRLVPAPEDGMYQAMADRDAQVHFARHDPARVLREIAAKRRRLQRHAPGSVVQDGDETWVRCNGHEWVEWPCEELIDDAQAWADRDDFPAELRLP